MAKMPSKNEIVDIQSVSTHSIQVCVLGKTPMICNRMSQKVIQELLFPPVPGAAKKSGQLKHDPLQEFRESPYTMEDAKAPTLLAIRGGMIKAAMRSAAIDLPGTAKAQIGRLAYVEGDYIPLYGVPQLMIAVVRNSGMNATPDPRSRAVLPQWACQVNITYVTPNLNQTSVVNLLSAAGIIRGLGDWRPEKGSGDFGQFEIVNPDDKRYLNVIKTGGRAAQIKALNNPESYDTETQTMLSWFKAETNRRGFKVAS